jgi:hypothetical protein
VPVWVDRAVLYCRLYAAAFAESLSYKNYRIKKFEIFGNTNLHPSRSVSVATKKML